MKLFPRNGHGFAGFQVFDPSGNFLVLGIFDRQMGSLQVIKQRVGQGSTFVTGKR
jgi:hypothetical protein